MYLKAITGTHASDVQRKYEQWEKDQGLKLSIDHTHYTETFVWMEHVEDSGINCTLLIFYK